MNKLERNPRFLLFKKIFRWLSLILGFVVICALTAIVLYRDYIRGPSLLPTPDSISLRLEFPFADGRNEDQVMDAMDFADRLGATSVIVIKGSRLIAEWGKTDLRSSVHSVRKSLLSALYGIAVERGPIDLSKTLSDLGIDDHDPALSETERRARLRDLLTARSGIYHPSIMDDNGPYPTAGTHLPDETFVYNNWSFNAAGGIFERLTGLSMGDAFLDWIAAPTGMQDFRPEDVIYYEGSQSVFQAWRFNMSTRDLIRFGLLYLRKGRWGDVQVVPSSWIDKSLTPYSRLENGVAYGYMWWIMPDGSFLATGTGGQKLRIFPKRDLVIAIKVNTGYGLSRAIWWKWGPRINNSDTVEIINRLFQDVL